MTTLQTNYFTTMPSGEQLFTATGSSTFTVPAGVYTISAVCVGAGGGGGDGGTNLETPGGGGGALAWVTNLPVVPGENLTVTVGAGGAGGATGNAGSSTLARGATVLVTATGGTNGGTTANAGSRAGGTFSFDASIVGVTGITTGGGNGGASGGATSTSGGSGGGGGAGGYSGTGGAGGNGATASSDGAAGAGGGGGGGEASAAGNNQAAGGGGGVGVNGSGANGAGGTGNTSAAGGGGSSGNNGSASGGGLYGGGGGGSSGNATAGIGANGAVRIVYGPGRSYPFDKIVTFFNSSTSTSGTVSVPSGIQAGDVAFLFDYAQSTTVTPTSVVPTGWTSINDSVALVNVGVSAGIRAISSYKILSSNDSGETITGMSSSTNRKMMLVFRPNFVVTSVTTGDINGEATINNPTAQVENIITLTQTSMPMVVMCHMASTGTITTRTVTGDTTTEVANGTTQYGQYKIFNVANATVSDITFDIADFGDNALQSFYATLNYSGTNP